MVDKKSNKYYRKCGVPKGSIESLKEVLSPTEIYRIQQ